MKRPLECESGRAVPFEAMVFDLDGTLLDTLPDLVELTNAVLRECGFPQRSSDEILSFVGNGVKALMYQAVPDDAPEDAVEDAMIRWKALYPQYGHRLTEPYPGMVSALEELKRRGVKLAVLSNKFDEGVQDVVRDFLPDLFEVVHGECEDIPRKPDPSGLLKTIKELETEPGFTAYVGDSAGDVKVARHAGASAIAVSWGYHSVEKLLEEAPDVLISSAAELLQFSLEPTGSA